MNKFKSILTTAAVFVLFVLCQSQVQAQATRTWVSGVGDDVNPCSRTAPCKTFAGAISKTAAGGEISALDPGGFGAVTITKSITINGDGTLAGILAASTNGIVINAGANDVVTLRSLSINGAVSGLDGIRYLAGGQVRVENCTIQGFTSDGIEANLATNGGKLSVKDTTINSPGATGIRAATTVGTFSLTLDNVYLQGMNNGLVVGNAVFANVSRSTFTQNLINGINTLSGGSLNMEGSTVSFNITGILVNSGSTIRLSNTSILDNSNGITNNGSYVSFSNNKVANNGPTAAPTSTLPLQ